MAVFNKTLTAIKSNMEVFLYPSFKAILKYRMAHKLYLKKHYFLARWISQRSARKTVDDRAEVLRCLLFLMLFNMIFDGCKAFSADDVFDAAGIVKSLFFVDAKLYKPV